MHPDHERYVKACSYPGLLDAVAVERHLADYLSALGVKRKIIRLPLGWSLRSHPSLENYVKEVLSAYTLGKSVV